MVGPDCYRTQLRQVTIGPAFVTFRRCSRRERPTTSRPMRSRSRSRKSGVPAPTCWTSRNRTRPARALTIHENRSHRARQSARPQVRPGPARPRDRARSRGELLPRPRRRSPRRTDRPDREHKRSVRAALQIARQRRRRGDGARAVVPALRAPCQVECVRPVTYQLASDGAWRIDLEALCDATTPRTRAIIVVSPNNPTGSTLKQYELLELVRICHKRGLALIADEVFADYVYESDPVMRHPSPRATKCSRSRSTGCQRSPVFHSSSSAGSSSTVPRTSPARRITRLEFLADLFFSRSEHPCSGRSPNCSSSQPGFNTDPRPDRAESRDARRGAHRGRRVLGPAVRSRVVRTRASSASDARRAARTRPPRTPRHTDPARLLL